MRLDTCVRDSLSLFLSVSLSLSLSLSLYLSLSLSHSPTRALSPSPSLWTNVQDSRQHTSGVDVVASSGLDCLLCGLDYLVSSLDCITRKFFAVSKCPDGH